MGIYDPGWGVRKEITDMATKKTPKSGKKLGSVKPLMKPPVHG
jgi:hypothetical protein